MERGSLNALDANSVKDKGKTKDLEGGASCSAEVIVDQCIDVMFICGEWGSSKGGLSTFNRELALNLAKYSKERIRVHCFVCQSTEEERQDASSNGIHLITAQRPPGSSDPLEWIRFPPSELSNPDIIVGHGRKFGGAAYSIRRITGCKWIHFVHVFCEDLGKYKLECSVTADAIADNEAKNKRELELCKASDSVVAVGSLLQGKYQRSLPDFKVEVITPGIFEKYVNPTARKSNKFESSGEDEFRIFMFGRGSFEDFELKGYDIIGKAVASLERKFELTFVGAPQDQQRKIEKWFLEETKITRNQLTIRGFCNYEEMREMFRQADVVVMPSRTEGFGLVALEAISAGVPVLVSRECGIAKALQTVDGGMAVVIPSASPEEWAKKIQELSQQTPDERYAYALHLRGNYGKRYHWKEECEKFMKMILQLAPSPTPKETLFTEKAPCSSNDKEKTQRKEVFTGTGDLPHSGLEVGKRDGREQSESAPDPDTSDKTAEQTRERRTDQDTSNKTREKTKGDKKKVQAAALDTSNETRGQTQGDEGEVQAAEKAPCSSNDKEETQRKAVLVATGNLPHSGSEVGKREGREQSESAPAKQNVLKTEETKKNLLSGFFQSIACKFRRTDKIKMQEMLEESERVGKALHSSLNCEETEGNKKGESVPGAAAYVSTKQAQRNTKEVWTATEKAPNTSLKRKRTDGNEQTKSVQDSGTALCGSTEEELKNEKEVCAATCTAVEGDTSVSENNKELNQLHSVEEEGDVTEMKSTLPRGFSVDSRNTTGRTPLMNAALNGNVQAVKSMIKRGADPSLTDNKGWNTLHHAAQGGDTDIISLIHTHLPNIESKTGEGYTPLMVAAFTGKLHAVKWFLEKGATVACESKRGWNTLHFAAQSGDTDIISLIHTHLPNIESKTGEGLTPLMVAAFTCKLHAVKWFLEKGATVACEDKRGWNTLHCAAQGGDTDIISLIHTHLPNIESKTGEGYTPLMVAAFTGKLHAVKWFLEKGATVACESKRGWNTLHFAAESGDTDIISLIHTHLPNIESKTGEGYTPLMVAAATGKLHAVKWFLEKGATVACEDKRGWNTLHCAAQGGDTDIISLIHTHLPNIESKTGEGYTPLMVAAFTGKLHAVKWFLEKGATVACESKRGWNTLHFAAQSGDTDIISLIHTHLPNIESKTGKGYTPLMVAAFNCKLHAVKWFLEKGATVACEDKRGWNTLHSAAQGGDTDIISLIHTHLPNIESKTGEGYTPLMVAAFTGKLHAVKWFLEKGATVACESKRGWNTLHFAAESGDTDIISLIHTHLPNIESKTGEGLTPLMVAAFTCKLHAVKWFLEKGATVACEDKRGWNTLHSAAQGGDTDIISLIHTHLPNIESKTGEGYTPLMVAAFTGELHAVKWFLEKGAAIACEDKRGWSPLHHAAKGGDPDTIDLILTHLPNVDSKAVDGETPLIIAVFHSKLQGVKYLLERGANPFAKDNKGQDSLYHASSCDSDCLDLLLNHVPRSESTTGND
ncbi:ankyrin-2-like isoform X9 [Pocillopora verrucosa]|uniref:ankyrin-2-like isoform X9 n=1 Tax=Pocillopora verrucosa TaxID=203993 RepID=UPI0033400C78